MRAEAIAAKFDTLAGMPLRPEVVAALRGVGDGLDALPACAALDTLLAGPTFR